MIRLGIELGEIRNIVSATNNYKTTYCLSLIKEFAERGNNVLYYSIENNTQKLLNRLLKSGMRVDKGKPIFRTLASLNLTSLRTQIQIDINKLKNIKLIIIDDINLFITDYMGMQMFTKDLAGILKSADIACIFTSQISNSNLNIPVRVQDIKYCSGIMNICDTVYGLKRRKIKEKLTILEKIKNLFRKKKNKIKMPIDKTVFISVLKNRFGTNNNGTYIMDVDEEKLKFNIKEN
jgi:KaiC/GvpD/RAD55 family RecA-like ATPase